MTPKRYEQVNITLTKTSESTNCLMYKEIIGDNNAPDNALSKVIERIPRTRIEIVWSLSIGGLIEMML